MDVNFGDQRRILASIRIRSLTNSVIDAPNLADAAIVYQGEPTTFQDRHRGRSLRASIFRPYVDLTHLTV
jgi:hypothetical protein